MLQIKRVKICLVKSLFKEQRHFQEPRTSSPQERHLLLRAAIIKTLISNLEVVCHLKATYLHKNNQMLKKKIKKRPNPWAHCLAVNQLETLHLWEATKEEFLPINLQLNKINLLIFLETLHLQLLPLIAFLAPILKEVAKVYLLKSLKLAEAYLGKNLKQLVHYLDKNQLL